MSKITCAEYYDILWGMFSHFRAGVVNPFPPIGEEGQPIMYYISLREWAQRWAKDLEVTPEQVETYLWKHGHCEYIEPVLALLSDKEAGENE